MKKVEIDFKGIKYIGEIHLTIAVALGFPDWYGNNLDALWDMLTGFIAPCAVSFLNAKSLSGDVATYADKVIDVFKEAERTYGTVTVTK